ncbi:RHS repeat family protein, partial [Escherichia coli]|uniref:RHS repeat domain-containing protein n=1 Tax=Escherichia coli TaxID=562 RepID=UPI00135EB7BF
LTSVKDAQGRETRYEYNAAGDLTAVITPDGNRSETQYDAWGNPAEQWQYDGHGWLREISHLSEGHRVAVHYGYDDKGRLTGER